MFKLKTSETFSWPVVCDFPVDGQHKKVEFTATFRTLSRDVLAERLANNPDDTDLDRMRKINDFVSDVLIDLDGITFTDDADNPIETTTAERKSRAINHPIIGPALLVAYQLGLGGRQRKN